MDILGGTPKFNWESGDLPTTWKSFRQHAEFMFNGPLKKKTEEEKCNYLMLWIGEKGRDVYSTWTLTADERKSLEVLYEKFKSYVEPKSNVLFSRYKFQSRVQGEDEMCEQFVIALKVLVKDCAYSKPDEMLRDRIVFGTNSPKIREKLINKGSELTLEQAIDIARLHEMSTAQLKTMAEEDSKVTNVQAVKAKKTADRGRKPRNNKSCGRCGRKHDTKEQCPAKDKACRHCKKVGHFEVVCRSKNQSQGSKNNVHSVTQGEDEMFVGMIGEVNKIDKTWNDTVVINNVPVKFQLDTGAKCNIIPHGTFKMLNCREALKESRVQLRSYSGHIIKSLGTVMLPCEKKGVIYNIAFHIVDMDAPAILGADCCESMGLLTRVNAVKQQDTDDIMSDPEYASLFSGLGCLPGTHQIKVDASATPVVHPPRRVPVALREKVKAELDRMEELNVVVKQTEPTDWVNSMVTVIKPDKVRICIDPKDLNTAIQREHYPMKTVEDVSANMAGARVFSKLDATSGFWQIKLDAESSRLTTFNTPFGRYRFLRMPFGLKSAPEVFQRLISQMVEDIDGAEAIVDDILVWGKNVEEHDARLHRVLQKAKEYNLKLNPAKCEFRKDSMSFVGHVFTSEGLKPDPEKIRAVESMTEPQNKQELQTFLGFIQYLGKFMPNMSEVSAPLRQLTENTVEWHWTEEHVDSFRRLKNMATHSPVLRYYDPDRPLTLSTDASSKGLGAVLLQGGQPIAYASRALTTAQQNYAQIEKETLAIVYGCEKFHQFIYGRKVLVESDHKPLQSIWCKPLHQAPARLQRLLLNLQKYDLDIFYKPGKYMFLADTLSRSFLPETKEQLVPEVDVNAINPRAYLPVSPERYDELQKETAADPVLRELREVVQSGWADTKEEVSLSLREYWTYRDEIICTDGLLFKGEKLIVPKSLRPMMLDIIHESHLGIVKCKSRAREVLFWPGMSSQIEEKVAQCEICAEHSKSNPKEPMIKVDLPDRPWAKIAADLFEYKSANYLLTVDYYSKWPELAKLDNETSQNTIAYLKSQMSRYGIPDQLVSDNGPQFSSYEFKKFTKNYGIVHTTTSPYHPQANGQVERTVQTVKDLVRKSEDPYKALMDFRNTPLDIGLSPAQMFLGRRLKTTLPTAATLLKPCIPDPNTVQQKLKQRQEKNKVYFDKHASKDLVPLSSGDPVMMKPTGKSKKWTRATVLSKHDTPRSYVVEAANGMKYRRNRIMLRATKSPLKQMDSSEAVHDENDTLVNTQQAGSPVKNTELSHECDISNKVVPRSRSGRELRMPSRLHDYEL